MKKKHLLRTVRNLFLAAFLAALMWIASDYPLPMEMDFRRAERQNLVDPSEIVWTYYGTHSGDLDVLVGLTPAPSTPMPAVTAFISFPGEKETAHWYLYPRRPAISMAPTVIWPPPF